MLHMKETIDYLQRTPYEERAKRAISIEFNLKEQSLPMMDTKVQVFVEDWMTGD